MKIVHQRYYSLKHEEIFKQVRSQLAEATKNWKPGTYDEYDMVDYMIQIAEGYENVEADYSYVDAVGICSPTGTTTYKTQLELYIGDDDAFEETIEFVVCE
jgi:hypothetical protein